MLVQCIAFLIEKNLKYYHIGRHFLQSTEIRASEEPNALKKAPVQFLPLRKLSRKVPVQFMPFWKLSGKCHFLVQFARVTEVRHIDFEEECSTTFNSKNVYHQSRRLVQQISPSDPRVS